MVYLSLAVHSRLCSFFLKVFIDLRIYTGRQVFFFGVAGLSMIVPASVLGPKYDTIYFSGSLNVLVMLKVVFPF